MKRRTIPVDLALKLRAEPMAWRDVAQEILWATGQLFAFDSVQSACYRAAKEVECR